MDVKQSVGKAIGDAPFIAHLGVELVAIGEGWCELRLRVQPWQLQQSGVVHAGVLATLADHCAGAAASTLLAEGQAVVSAEFKINLLRGARGDTLRCRADVLKTGRTLTVVEASVFADSAGGSELVARLNATMAIVGATNRR